MAFNKTFLQSIRDRGVTVGECSSECILTQRLRRIRRRIGLLLVGIVVIATDCIPMPSGDTFTQKNNGMR